MSNRGVGFTVFQVPGAKTPRQRSTGSARLGGGPVLATSGPSLGFGNPYTSSATSSSMIGTSPSTLTPPALASSSASADRLQRHSTTTFAVFQPPGGLQSILQRAGAPPVSLGAPLPYAGTSGSIGGSHSSTGSTCGRGGGSLRLASALSAPTIDDNETADQSRGGMSWMRTGRIIRVKDSGDSFRFPLETEHLPITHVSSEHFDRLKLELESLADTYVNSPATWLDNPTLCPQYRSQSWKPHVEKKNCVIYRLKEAADASHLQRRALLRAKLDTSLDDLEYAVNCSTTDDQRLYMSHCYQDSFLDSAVLQVHERATCDDAFHFVGIKWLAFQSSVDSVFSCRDALVVEFAKTMMDANGHKVLVKIQKSISMTECGGSERSFGFARTTGTWVWLFRGMGPMSGKVDVSAITEDHFDSSTRTTPSWVANRVLSTLHTAAINHATVADAKFLVRSRMITNKPWVPNNERPACFVCFKSFNLLRSRHHCRVCAEIMCGACTIELGIQASKLPLGMLPETGNGLIVSVEKFCLKCINRSRQDRRTALAAKSAGMIDLALDDVFDNEVPISYASRDSEIDYSEVSPAGGSILDHAVERELQPQQNHSLASSSSSTSSHSGTNGDKSGISFAGWSTKVLSAINREKSAECAKGQSLVTLTSASSSRNVLDAGACTPRSMRRGFDDRRRLNSDASGCTTSISSQSDCDSTSDLMSRRTDRDPIAGDAVVLLEEPSDVLHVTPLPTSFTKMEEQIAAQQALLRSMFIEGKKIMEQQQGYSRQVHPAQAQRHADQRQPPKSLSDKDRLALPPSSTSIEYID